MVTRHIILGIVSSIFWIPTASLGAGFFVQEQSVEGVGRAFAGEAALARDATTVWSNPAGITYLSEPEFHIGSHRLSSRADLNDGGTSLSTSFATTRTGGGSGKNPFGATHLLNVAFTMPVVDDLLWFGFAANSPFGLSVDYSDDWFGRYDSTRSQLLTVNLQPSAALRVTDWLSFGAGLNIQYAEAELENALPNVLPTSGDGELHVEGDDWSVGWNAGLLVELPTRTRLGLHYRSKIRHELRGFARFSGLVGPLAPLNGRTNGTADLDLPEIFSVSVVQPVGKRWLILGSYTYFGWDSFDEIAVKLNDGRSLVTPQGYGNSFSAALGVEYQWGPRLRLRTGVQFDETPTRDGFRTSRTPDADRYWLAAGVSYGIGESWELQASYAHVFIDREDIDVERTFYEGTPVATRFRFAADVDAAVDIVSLSVRRRF